MNQIDSGPKGTAYSTKKREKVEDVTKSGGLKKELEKLYELAVADHQIHLALTILEKLRNLGN